MSTKFLTNIMTFLLLYTAVTPVMASEKSFAPLHAAQAGEFLPVKDSLARRTPVRSHAKMNDANLQTLQSLEAALAPHKPEIAVKTASATSVRRSVKKAPVSSEAKANPAADSMILSLFAEAGEGPFTASFR